MALTAVLENQGLRPTSRGGHIAPYAAVAAQLDPPLGAESGEVPLQRLTISLRYMDEGCRVTETPIRLMVVGERAEGQHCG